MQETLISSLEGDITMDSIRLGLNIEKHSDLIDSALQLLSKGKHEGLDLVKEHKKVRDFQILQFAKDMPSISLNRYKNKEFYSFGQLMDRDCPIYQRAHGCKLILGLEQQRKAGAELLITLNERLGQYKNDHLKRLVEQKEQNFRFFHVSESQSNTFIRSDQAKASQTKIELEFQSDFIPLTEITGANEEKKQREEEKEKIEDYLSGKFKIVYDHLEGQVSQSKQLMHQIKENPHDMKVWLQYIHEQDKIHFQKPLQRIEKQLSICESGLKKNPESNILQFLYVFFKVQLIEQEESKQDLWVQSFKRIGFQNESFLNHYLTTEVFINKNNLTISEQRELIISLMRFLKVHQLTSQNKSLSQSLLFHLLRSYLHLEVSSGYQERAFYIIHSLFEISLASQLYPKLSHSILSEGYNEFCENEYPKIGEMSTYKGFIDYLILRETHEQELMLVKAKDELLREEVIPEQDVELEGFIGWYKIERDTLVNWRPRKTQYDSEFIDVNPESIVFYSDAKDVVEMIKVIMPEDLQILFGILMETMKLDCTFPGCRVSLANFQLEQIGLFVSGYPEYQHFKPEQSYIQDRWKIFKLRLAISILTQLLSLQTNIPISQILAQLITLESQLCFERWQKLSDSTLIKQLLKSYQGDIPLYLTYTHLLLIRGGISQAQKVLANMLTFHTDLKSQLQVLSFINRYHSILGISQMGIAWHAIQALRQQPIDILGGLFQKNLTLNDLQMMSLKKDVSKYFEDELNNKFANFESLRFLIVLNKVVMLEGDDHSKYMESWNALKAQFEEKLEQTKFDRTNPDTDIKLRQLEKDSFISDHVRFIYANKDKLPQKLLKRSLESLLSLETSQNTLLISLYFKLGLTGMSMLDRQFSFNMLFKEGQLDTSKNYLLWLRQENERLQGQVNWTERLIFIFKQWWKAQSSRLTGFLENQTTALPHFETPMDQLTFLLDFLKLLKLSVADKPQEQHTHLTYLLIALNQHSYNRDLFLDYMEGAVVQYYANRQRFKAEDLESVRDLFVLKELRINQVGGSGAEIPVEEYLIKQ
ncbi:hypothetical protein FGO68_gene7792 [Halteria grandinella]|uniref:Uncharacterized protein n=1 Tax=Halteria grandinella TaxID=5974 RepID=A0A8J8T8A7_HALGN|nr:hypothetical protein FGO68_gene7792 [Halteria grandinella]